MLAVFANVPAGLDRPVPCGLSDIMPHRRLHRRLQGAPLARRWRSSAWVAAALVAVVFGSLAGGQAQAQAETRTAELGAWVTGYNSKSRMIVGAAPGDTGLDVFAGLEIRMEPGWKTYWRHPGNAGGIPPRLDLSGSQNLKSFEVLYPAPSRLVDETGTTLGYKRAVTFPIRLVPQDPSAPIYVNVAADFGVCETICVPVFATFAGRVEPAALTVLPLSLAKALAEVPQPIDGDGASPAGAVGQAPTVNASAQLDGKEPHIMVRVDGAAAGASDVLAWAPGGLMLDVPENLGNGRFRVDILAETATDPAITDRRVIFTIKTDGGAYDRTWSLPSAAG